MLESVSASDEVSPGHPTRRASLLDTTRDLLRQHTESGARLTGKTLGDLLGVSDGYARRLLRQAVDQT